LWGRRVSGVGAQAVEGLTEIPGADLPALRDLFARALAEDPAGRFATALEFAGALKQACPNVAMAAAPAPAARRRAAREVPLEIEPRLPLDGDDSADEGGLPLSVAPRDVPDA